jgi:hypothetical protein
VSPPTYRALVEWLIAKQRVDLLCDIISASLGNLAGQAHLIILLDLVSEHLRTGMPDDPQVPVGCTGNLTAFYNVWLFLDCPGLDDASVVTIMKGASLFDEFRESWACQAPSSS